MNQINTVSIKIQTGVYGQFRNLNNKVWFALSEFVDNAVQSYENNKEVLKKFHKSNYQFEVRIDIDLDKNCIRIYDNAAGIDEKNFLRAFEPANIPTDNTGLHEFGMGMKTASIWLADLWSVRSAALGETEERFVEFDLKKVMDEEKEELQVKNTTKNKTEHYTELTLHNLSKNAPTQYQFDKLKKHLSSIYRKFIRRGDLKLYFNNEILTYEDPEILKSPYYTNPRGKTIEWKKRINFSMGKYKVHGFIAILNTMSTSELNGLSLFRRGRVIEGSNGEKYKPKVLCGQVGSPRFKRIFGELELEGFNVSFNKGSFQEQEDLETLMVALQAEISSKEFDIYGQAEKYIKPRDSEFNEKAAKKIVSGLKKTKVSIADGSSEPPSLKDLKKRDSVKKNSKINKKAKVINSHEEELEIEGVKYIIKVDMITDNKVTDLYDVSFESNEKNLKMISVKLNLAHLFFVRFKNFKNEKDYLPFVSLIRSLALAEILAKNMGSKNPGYVRVNFNYIQKHYNL